MNSEPVVVGVSNGVSLTDTDVDVLADEAERGYEAELSCKQSEEA